MARRPARNSRIEKPAVHQIVTQATAGMNQSRDLKIGTRGMPSQSSTCMAMPNWKFSIQSQIR